MSDHPPFDGCEVVRRLHSGPIADLYHAVQRPLGRAVLIKALGPSILPSSPFATTLEREARILAELDHPNILHLYDFVRTDERMWLVLEYVDGWSLDELHRKVGRFSPAAATGVALEVARALAHAHGRGIVHRALEPKNVLISQRGMVRITNFAVAVAERLPTAPELYDGSSNLYAPTYMSPEQILGEPVDARSDLFSLGVVLYELLTGRHPFDAPDERTAAQRIRHDHPAALTRAVPDVPGSLERAVHRCLEKMPSDRFHDAGELERALKSALKELGSGGAREHIHALLVRAGLSSEPPLQEEAGPRSQFIAEQPSLRPALVGLGIAAALLLLGSGVIHLLTRSADRGAGRASHPLELMPASAAYLRVVAEPWAHVVVDGQRVDTTPFARPIPLPAGTHYVRLEHPNAPTERRSITLAPGETVLLDVKMNVVVPSSSASATALPQEPPDGGVDAGPPSP